MTLDHPVTATSPSGFRDLRHARRGGLWGDLRMWRVKSLDAILATAEKKSLSRSLAPCAADAAGHRSGDRHGHLRAHRHGGPKGGPRHDGVFHHRWRDLRPGRALLLRTGLDGAGGGLGLHLLLRRHGRADGLARRLGADPRICAGRQRRGGRLVRPDRGLPSLPWGGSATCLDRGAARSPWAISSKAAKSAG